MSNLLIMHTYWKLNHPYAGWCYGIWSLAKFMELITYFLNFCIPVSMQEHFYDNDTTSCSILVVQLYETVPNVILVSSRWFVFVHAHSYCKITVILICQSYLQQITLSFISLCFLIWSFIYDNMGKGGAMDWVGWIRNQNHCNLIPDCIVGNHHTRYCRVFLFHFFLFSP